MSLESSVWVAPAGPHRRRGCRWELLPGWHTRRESANPESRPPVSTRSTQVPSGTGACRRGAPQPPRGPLRHRAWEHRRVDLEGISALLTEQGWALLESLPPYDEAEAMS